MTSKKAEERRGDREREKKKEMSGEALRRMVEDTRLGEEGVNQLPAPPIPSLLPLPHSRCLVNM